MASTPPETQDSASIWQWFVIDSEKSTSTSAKLSKIPSRTVIDPPAYGLRAGRVTAILLGVKKADGQYDVLWAVAHGPPAATDSASSENTKNATTSNTHVQIGFRAMKVTIDRPWFKGQLLGQTKEFFDFKANKISAGDPHDIHKSLSNGEHVEAGECILPSWATAFIVVKDVHIILTHNESFESSEIKDMQKASASGGGFLCFQASKSEWSSYHRDAFSMTHENNRISIRIPAPQILGWVSQLAPDDHSLKTYTPFSDKEFAESPKSLKGELPTPPLTPSR